MGEENRKEKAVVTKGSNINLYLDKDGCLVITDQKRDLVPLGCTTDFTIYAPLDDVVRADVRFLVSRIDLSLDPANVRFVVGGEEISSALLAECRSALERRRGTQASVSATPLPEPKFALWQWVETLMAGVTAGADGGLRCVCKALVGLGPRRQLLMAVAGLLSFQIEKRFYDVKMGEWIYSPFDPAGSRFVPNTWTSESLLFPHTMTPDDLTEFQKSVRPGTKVRVVQYPVGPDGLPLCTVGPTDDAALLGSVKRAKHVFRFPLNDLLCSLIPGRFLRIRALGLMGGETVWPWNVEDPDGPARNGSEPEKKP